MSDVITRALDELSNAGLGAWCDVLRESAERTMHPASHGHIDKWQDAVKRLPQLQVDRAVLQAPAVTFTGECSVAERMQLRDSLMEFHPWRKGPFHLFGVDVDAEWRSDLKWARIQPHLSLEQKTVLDVGCGNGYYGWRMLGAGASFVVGLEPYPLYNAQFSAISQLGPALRNFVVPASDACLLEPLRYFDVAFSMGVLYHSKDPFNHLQKLKQAVRPGGLVVLETLVVDGDANTMLIPQQRYAKMRNVWILPSTLMLTRMLSRIGFRHIHVVDVTRTTAQEQRRTDWMTFESLADFLDPHDVSRTVEGEPAPLRATFVATA